MSLFNEPGYVDYFFDLVLSYSRRTHSPQVEIHRIPAKLINGDYYAAPTVLPPTPSVLTGDRINQIERWERYTSDLEDPFRTMYCLKSDIPASIERLLSDAQREVAEKLALCQSASPATEIAQEDFLDFRVANDEQDPHKLLLHFLAMKERFSRPLRQVSYDLFRDANEAHEPAEGLPYA